MLLRRASGCAALGRAGVAWGLPSVRAGAAFGSHAPPQGDAADAGPFTRVTVASARLVSPDVRHVVLGVPPASSGSLRFKAGQYLDVRPAGTPSSAPGGLSLCSTPAMLAASGTLEVAVKRSSQESLRWLYGDASVGTEVDVRVGGKTFGDASVGPRPLLLVAGGIGVAPMLSLLRDRRERAAQGAKTYFMYVAKTEADLAFREQVEALLGPDEFLMKVTVPVEAWALDADEWERDGGGARAAARASRLPSGRFTVADYRMALARLTGVEVGSAEALPPVEDEGRPAHISAAPILSSREREANGGVTAAVCGPQAMNEYVGNLLLHGLGVGEVLVERW